MKVASIALAALALPLFALAQTPAAKPATTAKAAAAPSLVGVWRRVESDIGSGADKGKHAADVQPSLYVFTKTHYSTTWVTGYKPRPVLSDKPTDAEVTAAANGFAANAGTYTVVGGKLTMTPLVAKSPNLMAAGAAPLTADLEWAGKDVWLVTPSSDGTKNRARLARVAD